MTLVVVPSRRAGARFADPLLRSHPQLASTATWTDEIVTMRDLVEIASAGHPDPRPRLGRTAMTLLTSEVVERLEPEVRALFGPGLDGPGSSRAIESALARIRMADLSAVDLALVAAGRRRLQGLAAALDLWERRLAAGGWWDDAAAHRAAIEAIESGSWPTETLDRLEVREIYDLTPLQGRLLLALAERSRVVRVDVPFDPEDEESSRFAFPYIHLWESLTDPGLDVELVFPDRRSPERIVFAAGTDRADEVRRLADWLRRLGEAGEPLEETGVVVAEGGSSHHHIARELDRRGVPWHARRAAPLAETSAFAAALLPFRLLEDGFRRVDLVAWVTTPLTVGLVPELLRPALAVGPAGHARPAQWNRSLATVRGESAARLVHALSEIEALGREPRSPEEFWARWSRLLSTVGVDPSESWEEVVAELREGLESVERWAGPALPWRTHRRQLLSVLSERRARIGRPGRGVQVLTPYDARGLVFRHLAVIGLAQGALVGRDPSLSVFGERERRVLGARFGTELFRLPGEATAEATLLLQAWVRSTSGEVRLSWPARDEDGAPLLPALEYERLRRLHGARLPDATRSAPLTAWRMGVAAARVAELQELEAARAAFFARKIEERRGMGGRYDGAFDPRLRPLLAAEAREGGALHEWTPGQLEIFRQCPHRFFQRHVLRLEPPDETPLEAEPSAIGGVVHKALELLFSESLGPEPPARERIDAALSAAESAAEFPRRGDPDVWRILLSRAAALLDSYFHRLLPAETADPFVPEKFEAAFGLDPDGAPGVSIETSLGGVVLRGRIDRLDRHPASMRLRVIDYKYSVADRQRDSVRVETCGIDRFQLWGYYLGARVWAEKEGWGEPSAVLGEIHCLREIRGKPVLLAPPSPPLADVEKAVAAVVEMALSGHYDPSPLDKETCKYCEYRRSCRIATVALGAAPGPEEDEA